MNASKIVNGSIIGADFETIIINNKSYVISSPTIYKIAGAGYYLSDLPECKTVHDILVSLKNIEAAAHALSWFIQGDDKLFKELSYGTFDEVVQGLETAFSMISAENFCKLSALSKNVRSLTAKQK
ncbi:hypothetical protein [Bacteroides gallinarum]|uniref:hypothetical protein n=1 Tax=Bacteroides gallinarum TaxID=376806 RepID=UPI00037E9743|nr:hypothetical protein [Bacteroides gallinarum]